MELKPHLRTHAEVKLVLNQMLRRSLEILQMPQLELAAFITEEIDQNPLLEPAEDFSLPHPTYILPEPPARISLYEHLLAQVRELPLKHQKLIFFKSDSADLLRIIPIVDLNLKS